MQPLEWKYVLDDIEKFREQYIDLSIIESEIKDKSMLNWLFKLHLFDYFIVDPSEDSTSVVSNNLYYFKYSIVIMQESRIVSLYELTFLIK